jgi:MFS family permease
MGRRKPLIIAGYGLSSLGKLFLPFSSAWGHVFLLKTLERSGKGLRTAPRDAIVADSATRGARGRGFGVLRALDSTGAILGSALAYLLWNLGLDLRTILLLAAILSLLALLPLLLVRDVVVTSAIRPDLSHFALSPQLRQLVLIASLFALGNISYMFFLLQAQKVFLGSVAAPLLLYVLFNGVYAALAVPGGLLSDRWGRRPVLAIGYSLFAVISLGFVYASSLLSFVLLFALYGLVFALVDGTERAFVSDLCSAEGRGTSLGVYHSAVGLSSILSGVLAGMLWEIYGPSATFIAGGVLAGIASMVLVLGFQDFKESA